jgi:hypothetical protein
MQILTPSVIENDVIVEKETITHLLCPFCNFDISEAEVNSKHCNSCDQDFQDPAKLIGVFRGK